MEFLWAVGACVVVFLVMWLRRGAASAAAFAILFGCALAPLTLWTFGEPTTIAAMAPPVVTLAAYHLALVGAVLALPRQVFRGIPPVFLLFLLSIVVLAAARGLLEPHHLSGMLQWLSAVVAWGVGSAVAESARENGQPTQRWIAVCIAAVVAWHAVIVAQQLFGGRAVSAIAVGASEVARVSGLAGASGNLGKIMFCLVLLLLPLTRSPDHVARRVATATVAVAALLTGLSYSRANTVAILIVVALWLLLGPGIALSRRIVVPAVGAVVAIPIVDVLILRNQYDPEGGSRPVLLETAFRQIGETLWFGVGPNGYLDVVGRYDALSAGGLPVHSAVLLALAEIGLFSFVLLVIPLAAAVVTSLRNVRGAGSARLYSLVLLGGVPGALIIATTGWGVIRGQFLILSFFTIGYLLSAQRARRAEQSPLTADLTGSTVTGGGGRRG